MQKKIISIKHLVFLIIIIGIALRLFQLSELFHFTYDEEIIAFVGKRMFVNHHVPLIGGVTPMHVHLAPYFYWLSGLVLGISSLNPLGWGVFAALLAGLTLFFLYKTGKLFFNEKIALIAVSLYAFSFFQNIFDRHYWGLAFNGIISLVTLFSLYKISLKNEKYLFVLVSALAFGFHTDPSTLVLFVLSLLTFFVLKIKVSFPNAFFAGVIFLISFLPLVLFDMRHNFSNSNGLFQYIEEINSGRERAIEIKVTDVILFVPRTLSRTLYVYGDTNLAKQYSYCAQHAIGRLYDVPAILLLIVITILISSIYYLKKEKSENKKNGLKLLLLLFGAVYIGIIIYGLFFKGDLFDHYLSTLFPPFYLICAYVSWKLFQKNNKLLFLVITTFILLNFQLLIAVRHMYGFSDKSQAVKWAIQRTGNEQFSLDVISSCFRYNGYRYLFYLYGKEPEKSYVDANFTYLYDKPPAEMHPKWLIVITNPDFRETKEYIEEYTHYLTKTVDRKKFGQIEILLVDNSNLDFVGKF